MKYSDSSAGYRLPPISEEYASPLRIRAAEENITIRKLIEEALDLRLKAPPPLKKK